MGNEKDLGQMSESQDGTLLQVVNYEENFNDDLEDFLAKRGMLSAASFRTVAVIGPQSSGKSTLLNLLFDMRFLTMDEAQGRYQVTQGVWLGYDAETSTIILDLEGTDSRERGEDAVSFERKSALFALALAEVLLINIWTQDVGRLNASNFALLKTVLELDLQLFHGKAKDTPMDGAQNGDPQCKTKLLFVLRDHVSTPLERLADILRTDLEKIWAGIDKPAELATSALYDFFDLQFTSLPHKVLAPDEFEKRALELRAEFQSGRVFDAKYIRGVTPDGFAIFSESVWRTIRSNKDLDIPAQKLLVASMRCDALSHDALVQAAGVLDSIRAQQRGTYEYADGLKLDLDRRNLGSVLSDIRAHALDSYHSGADRYDESIRAAKESNMLSVLDAKLEQLYITHVESHRANAEAQFEAWCNERANSDHSSPWIHFRKELDDTRTSCLANFNSECGEVRGLAYSPSDARSKLVDKLDQLGNRCEQALLARLMKTLVDQFRCEVKQVTEKAVQKMDKTRWAALASEGIKWKERYNAALDTGLGKDGLHIAANAREEIRDKLHATCAQVAFECAESALGTPGAAELRLGRSFDQMFRFTERGVPRGWHEKDDVEALYINARDAVEHLVTVFSSVDFGPYGSSKLFDDEQCVQLTERLRQNASNAYLDAQRMKESNIRHTKIPAWMFGLLFVLGFNEGVAILRNPWLLVLVLILAPLVYFYFVLDLHKIVAPTIRTAAEPTLGILHDLLSQALEAMGAEETHRDGTVLGVPLRPNPTESVTSSSASLKPRREVGLADSSSEVSSTGATVFKKTT
mmetsp:Transcript_5404/g.14499  ORF Transcript_5404/g.14499 Transcript_5404/m.14499 type:complete len:807 (+) Transcript_5404:31-2451(+)